MTGGAPARGKILVAGAGQQPATDLAELLTAEGYQVHTAGADASLPQAAQALAADLLLLEVGAPGLDALEVLRRLEQDAQVAQIPTLLVADRASGPEAELLLAAGAADLIYRPLVKPEVLARIQTHLGWAAAKRQLSETGAQLERERRLRLQLEAVVHEAEKSGQGLIDTLSEIIYTADQDGKFTYTSPAVARLLGYEPSELVDRSLSDLVHEQDRDQLRADLHQLRGGQPVVGLYRLVTKSGEVRWARATSEAIADGDSALGFQGVLTDVTEQRQAAQRLEAQNEFLKSVLESLTHPFYVIRTDDYTIEIANSAARREGRSGASTCYALTHRRSEPCDTAAHPCPLMRIKASKQPVTVQHIHYNAEGEKRHVEVHGYPLLDEKGEVSRVIEYSLDVTERQQAEEALRQREREYRQLLEALQEGIWAIDEQGVTTFVNPRMAEMLGYTVEEMEGKHLFAFMDEQGIEITELNLARRRQGIREQHDFELIHKDGRRIYTSMEASPILDEAGDYAGSIAGVQDITERRQTQEALRKSEALLRETQQIARVGGWELDLVSSDLRWTDEVRRIHEVPRGYEPTLEAALDFYHPEDRPVLEGAIQHAIETGAPWDLELRFITAAGRHLWVRAIGQAEFSDGRAVRLAGIFQDITTRKQAEEALRESEARWRSVAENSPDHVILLDTDLKIQFVNYPSPGLTISQLIGTPLHTYVQEDGQEEIRQILQGVLETGEPASYETEYQTRDAGTIYYESRVVPRVLDEKIVGLAVNARDITAHKRAEQELREAIAFAKEAQSAERARRQEVEQRRRVAESLTGVLAALNSDQPLHQVLDLITGEVRDRLDNEAVAVYQVDADTARLRLESAEGQLANEMLDPLFPAVREALAHAIRSREPVMISDLAATLSTEATPFAVLGQLAAPFQALLAVPVVVKDEAYGGLLLGRSEPHAFSEEEVSLATAFADQIALAVDNARLRDQAERAAAAAERERLARDLHDSVTQALFSASLVAEVLPQVWRRDPEEAQEGLDELRLLTRGALAEMRTLLLELRPAALTEARLDDLVRQLTEAITSRSPLEARLDLEPIPSLPPEVQVTFYRVAQEALHNVVKHANARHITVGLRASPALKTVDSERWRGQIILHVRDDGDGFDPRATPPDRLGLSIMRERARSVGALLSLQSQPGQHTQVTLVWQRD